MLIMKWTENPYKWINYIYLISFTTYLTVLLGKTIYNSAIESHLALSGDKASHNKYRATPWNTQIIT